MSNLMILEPNHRFLESFQNALEKHLIKQIEEQEIDLVEIDNEYKKVSESYKSLAREIDSYEIQTKLQNNLMVKNETELKMYFDEIASKQIKLETGRQQVFDLEQDMDEARKIDVNLTKELTGLRRFHDFLTDLANDQKNFMKIQNNEALKITTGIDVGKKLKNETDLLVYKLTEEIFNFENDLITTNLQLKIKKEEKKSLDEHVVRQTQQLDILANEHKRTIVSWNAIIQKISQKDAIFHEIMNEFEKIQNDLKVTEKEIDVLKNEEASETERNERIALLLNQIGDDLRTLNDRNRNEMANVQKTQNNLCELLLKIEKNGQEVDEIRVELKNRKQTSDTIEKQFVSIENEKCRLQNDLVRTMQENDCNGKLTKSLAKQLDELREQNRSSELEVDKMDNANGVLRCAIESRRKSIADFEMYLHDLHRQESELKICFGKIDQRIKQFKQIIESKHSCLSLLSRKLQERLQKTEGIEKSEIDLKIDSLTKNANEINAKIRECKQFWIVQQTSIVKLSEKREKQLNMIQILKQQKAIMERKNSTLNDEMESYDAMKQEICRQIENSQRRIVKISEKIAESELSKENLRKSLTIAESNWKIELDSIQKTCCALEAELVVCETNGQTICERLVNFNRELIAWQRKVDDLLQTKQAIDCESSRNDCESVRLKTEIQRLNGQHEQMRKNAEKLSAALEFTVRKREAILSANKLLEKTVRGGGQVQSKVYFSLRCDQIDKDIKRLKIKIQKENDSDANLNLEIDKKQIEFAKVIEKFDSILFEFKCLDGHLNLLKLEKQKNLDLITLKQTLVNYLDDVLNGKYKNLFKNVTQMERERVNLDLQQENLLKIVNDLKTGFEELKFEFEKISNLLTLELFERN